MAGVLAAGHGTRYTRIHLESQVCFVMTAKLVHYHGESERTRLNGAGPSGRTPLVRYNIVSHTPFGTMTERKRAIGGA